MGGQLGVGGGSGGGRWRQGERRAMRFIANDPHDFTGSTKRTVAHLTSGCSASAAGWVAEQRTSPGRDPSTIGPTSRCSRPCCRAACCARQARPLATNAILQPHDGGDHSLRWGC